MIKEKLLVLEYSLATKPSIDYKKTEAIQQLKTALKQIDFNSEIIPVDDFKRLTSLFESLLNRKLNQIEKSIIKNLIEP